MVIFGLCERWWCYVWDWCLDVRDGRGVYWFSGVTWWMTNEASHLNLNESLLAQSVWLMGLWGEWCTLKVNQYILNILASSRPREFVLLSRTWRETAYVCVSFGLGRFRCVCVCVCVCWVGLGVVSKQTRRALLADSLPWWTWDDVSRPNQITNRRRALLANQRRKRRDLP